MYKRQSAFFHPTLVCKDASRTKKEFFRDSIIENIIAKYKTTGVLEQPNLNRPVIPSCDMEYQTQDAANESTIARINMQERTYDQRSETDSNDKATVHSEASDKVQQPQETKETFGDASKVETSK